MLWSIRMASERCSRYGTACGEVSQMILAGKKDVVRQQLRIVQSDTEGPVEMAAAIEAVAKECAAAMPSVVLVSWEGEGGTVTCRTLPNSAVVRRGMIYALYENE